MSLKRKLDANGTPSSSSSAPAPKVQLSAFAAAKVRASTTDLNDGEDSILESDRDDYTTSRRTSVSAGINVPEDEGDDADYADRLTEDAHFRNVQLSTWKLIHKNSSRLSWSEDSINIELLPNETMAIIGCYDIIVKFGAITLYGATLKANAKPYRVYAPASHALPVIEGSPAGKAKIEILVVNNDLKSMVRLSPLFKRLWNKDKDVSEDIKILSKQSCQFLRTAADDPDRRLLYGLLEPPDWRDSMRRIAMSTSKTSSTKVLVTGFNGSGKSTFARLLTNYLVTRPATARNNTSPEINPTVCWLELDPAHPEFSPPGQLSLVLVSQPILGPAYTHSYVDNVNGVEVLRAHNIAMITLKDDPAQYLACAINLFGYYEANHSESTLIINCPKWAIGEGLETLLELIKGLPCTDLVFMLKGQAPEEQYTRDLPEVRQDTAITMSLRPPMETLSLVLDILRKSGRKTNMHYLSRVHRPSLAFRTAAEFRHMQTMSYFQSLDPVYGLPKWESSALFARSPWFASYDQRSPDILGILNVGAPTTADNLSTVTDGMVLALCVLEDDDEAEYAFSRLERTDEEGLPYWPPGVALMSAPPNPDHSHAIGFVYCQAIDSESRTLVLQTPIEKDALEATYLKTGTGVPKLFLMRGSLDMPAWAYLELDHLRRPVGKSETKQGLAIESSKNVKRKREADLTQNHDALNPGYDVDMRKPGETNKVTGSVDVNGKHVIPYVAEVGEVDTTGQRWRTRHDIGRR